MKPAGRLQGAIDILRAITLDKVSPEKALLDWARSHRFAGSSDRRAIHETVYDVLRHYGTLSYYLKTKEPAYLVAAWLFFNKKFKKNDIIELFNSEKHAPKKLPQDIISCLNNRHKTVDTFEAQYNINAQLEYLFYQSLDSNIRDSVLKSLLPRAPLDIRVNLKHITRAEALKILNEDFDSSSNFTCPQHIPTLIRSYENLNIQLTDLYQKGYIEIQDGASQYASHLIANHFKTEVKSSQEASEKTNGRLLDYCAGGGGKALAIADSLSSEVEIIGSDISEKRLKSLKDRAIRAGSKNIRIIASHRISPSKGIFDMVIVDSPCSGSGAWRRNIYDKWCTTPQEVQEYTSIQQDILQKASYFTAKNGFLVYMTCSLFQCENDAIIADFLQKNPHFKHSNFQNLAFGRQTKFGLSFNPAEHNVDGFYISLLEHISKSIINE